MNGFRTAAIWLTLLCFFISGAPVSSWAITIQEEEDLSVEFLRVLKRHFILVDDPVVVDYVDGVGRRILKAIPPQPFTYHFYVVEQDVFNAFATPAGHIFVFSGLIEALDREEELAGILAHEIAHVQCRHISDKIGRAKKANMMSLAGTIAGILLGVGGMPDVGQAVAVGSAAGAQSSMLAYSRQDETQADQFGLSNLFNAGYNGDGLVSGFEKIRSKTWFGSKDVPTYLMTHPAVEDRIVGLKTQVDAYQNANGRPPDVDNTPFIRAQSRLITNPAAAQNQLKRFEAEVQKHPGDPMAHYRFGLMLAKVGRSNEAIAQLRSSLAGRAFDPVILGDLGRIYFLNGQYEDAVSTLTSVIEMSPGDVEGEFYLGRALMETGNFIEAKGHLKTLVRDHPSYTEAYFFLGKCYDRLGEKVDSLYYLGRYYHLKGELRKAVFQLEKAREADLSGARAEDIQSLMDDIKGAEKEQKKRDSQERELGPRRRIG
ncbi:MAG: M48 family metalloprotease [Desulfobacterales bacterium]|jgi:predicted Zn-dependent protease